MQRSLLFLATILIVLGTKAQLEALPYSPQKATLPEWVQLMYAPDPDAGAVVDAYDAYYASHPFVKNSHTQYYKRWKRELGHEQVPKDPQQRANYPCRVRRIGVASDRSIGTMARSPRAMPVVPRTSTR